jgi:hypothetical protein
MEYRAFVEALALAGVSERFESTVVFSERLKGLGSRLF